jgi:hypothetical protein
MSLLVTRLVRCARLPLSLSQRPTSKGLLLALADDCRDDGSHAFPSRITLAREVEVSGRTVDAHLKILSMLGLIVEQAPPTQHRPRTWRLDLARICALADPQAVATLSESERQLVATLTNHQPLLPFGLGSQAVATLQASESQNRSPESQPVATEPSWNFKNQEQRRSAAATEPKGDNFHVIKRLAIEILATTNLRGGDLVEAVKSRCAVLQIDYGLSEKVPCQVVGRACGCAEIQALKAVRHAS